MVLFWLALAVVVGRGIKSSREGRNFACGNSFDFFFISLHVFLFCVLHMYVSLVLKGNNKKNGNQLSLKQKHPRLFFVPFSRLFTFSGL